MVSFTFCPVIGSAVISVLLGNRGWLEVRAGDLSGGAVPFLWDFLGHSGGSVSWGG